MSKESVLDLSFASRSLAGKINDWQVIKGLGSDHYGLLFAISAPPTQDKSCPPASSRYNTKDPENWDVFKATLQTAIENNAVLATVDSFPCPTPELSKALLTGSNPELKRNLDELGKALSTVLEEACKAAFPLQTQAPKSKPWWSKDLKTLRVDMLSKQRKLVEALANSTREATFIWKRDYLLARNSYFEAIKNAKRAHWNQFLEKEDPKSIFKAMAYTKEASKQRIPAIQSSSQLEETFQGKCDAFVEALYPPPPETAPISWENYQAKHWDWPALTRIELHNACSSKIKSSTPGPDSITQEMITAAYNHQPHTFFQVYSILFNFGYHPTCWKQATGVILKKAGKPDYSIPKAYRIIALLNCLGKVVERVIAKRLGALAETTNLIHPTQIGGRNQKSAIDAALLLYNNVQEQRKLGKVTSTVFVDVKGAFDHVACNRFLAILAQLGLPLSLISWIFAFLTERFLQLSFDGQIQAFRQIIAGIPQGSPASPILFLIYIHQLFGSLSNFTLSYMDDVSISASSTSLKKNVKMLEQDIATLFSLGAPSAIQFDLPKTELIHFKSGRGSTTTSLCLPDGTTIAPATTVRWLGVYFDNKLSFKDHVSTQTSQARSAFYRMCRLANSEKGLSPLALRQLYLACVTSIADYGSQIYWKGQSGFKDSLQTLQNCALRKILGTFRTSPTLPSEVEATLPPPNIRLDSAMRQFAFRIYKLPHHHPLQQASRAIENQLYPPDVDSDSDASETSAQQQANRMLQGPPRQLQRILESIYNILPPYSEAIIHHSFPPWKQLAPYRAIISQTSKKTAAKMHNAYLESKIGSNLLAIYSDASALKEGTGIGIGLAAYNYALGAQEVCTQQRNIGENQLVYNGELEGITLSFEYAATVAVPDQEIRVYTDNQAAIYRLQTPSDKPGQCWQLRCIKAANEIISKGATISIHWVPGHMTVKGNERADSLAKEAALQVFPDSETTSLAMTGMRIKQVAKRQWLEALNKAAPKAIQRNPATYCAKFTWKPQDKLLIPMGTKRAIASAFYQLKTGHGYNKAYLHRINKVDSPNCTCGAKQTPEHLLLECRWYKSDHQILKKAVGNNSPSLALLLHTRKGIEATLAFISSTGIGTRRWYLGLDQDLD